MVKQRNWAAYDLYRKDEERLFLERAKQVAWGIDTPWEPKSRGSKWWQTSSIPYKGKGDVCLAEGKVWVQLRNS